MTFYEFKYVHDVKTKWNLDVHKCKFKRFNGILTLIFCKTLFAWAVHCSVGNLVNFHLRQKVTLMQNSVLIVFFCRFLELVLGKLWSLKS